MSEPVNRQMYEKRETQTSVALLTAQTTLGSFLRQKKNAEIGRPPGAATEANDEHIAITMQPAGWFQRKIVR